MLKHRNNHYLFFEINSLAKYLRMGVRLTILIMLGIKGCDRFEIDLL